MKYPKYSRRFQVDYFEIDKNLYRVTSHLQDHLHDILVTVDVSVPDMLIKNAEVEFLRYPLERCKEICERMKKIIGQSLYSDFKGTVLEEFFGSNGCPNVGSLLVISATALPPFYIEERIKLGKLEQKAWEKLGGNCLVH